MCNAAFAGFAADRKKQVLTHGLKILSSSQII